MAIGKLDGGAVGVKSVGTSVVAQTGASVGNRVARVGTGDPKGDDVGKSAGSVFGAFVGIMAGWIEDSVPANGTPKKVSGGVHVVPL